MTTSETETAPPKQQQGRNKINDHPPADTAAPPPSPPQSAPPLLKSNFLTAHPNGVSILVSDLRGFTSTTRLHGIVHFASVIIRMRQLCLPIFARHSALEVTTEADNFIVVFDSVESTIRAAVEMRDVLDRYNGTLSPERKHYAVRLNGIGIGWGGDVVMDLEDCLHGKPFLDAYHLGEDVCEDGMILLTHSAAERIREVSSADGSIMKGMRLVDYEHEDDEDDDDDDEARESTNTVVHQRIQIDDVSAAIPPNSRADLVGFDDDTYLPHPLVSFAKRNDPTFAAAVVETTDESAKADNGDSDKNDRDGDGRIRPYSVLMYELDLHQTARQDGAIASVNLKNAALEVLRPALKSRNGVELEGELWSFDDPVDAVLAALEARTAVGSHNDKLEKEAKEEGGDGKEHKHKQHIDIGGWGIHVGPMLFVEGTDVHWGNPVNTASKLGQDLAEGGDLLLTDEVYDAYVASPSSAKGAAGAGAASFERRLLRRSGVDLPCYAVSSGQRREGKVAAAAMEGMTLSASGKEGRLEPLMEDGGSNGRAGESARPTLLSTQQKQKQKPRPKLRNGFNLLSRRNLNSNGSGGGGGGGGFNFISRRNLFKKNPDGDD